MILLLAAGWTVEAQEAPEGRLAETSLEQILQRIAEANRLPAGLEFRQEIVLRAYLLTWRFESRVEVTSDGFQSHTSGAPSFVPDTLPEELVGLSQSAALFDLSPVEWGDTGTLVLQGPRREYPGTGPKEATLWVDSREWVISRAEAVYEWGTLHVTQEYAPQDGMRLLARQRARITPYGFTLDVEYRDYQIP